MQVSGMASSRALGQRHSSTHCSLAQLDLSAMFILQTHCGNLLGEGGSEWVNFLTSQSRALLLDPFTYSAVRANDWGAIPRSPSHRVDLGMECQISKQIRDKANP